MVHLLQLIDTVYLNAHVDMAVLIVFVYVEDDDDDVYKDYVYED